jgi:hypothetical protein
VLVVVVSTTSTPSAARAPTIGSTASISPTLTACSQTRRTPGALAGSGGGMKPKRCQNPPP